jgi:multidrug efflux pump subunit AcrA (membrane-fusion protein)
MEIEVPNPGFRLKPGMYARVQLTVASKSDAVSVPSNAIVRLDGKPGVFTVQGRSGGANGNGQRSAVNDAKPAADAKSVGSSGAGEGGEKTMTAKFVPVEMGIRDGDAVEIVAGVRDGMRVITTGAGALKDGDRVVASTSSENGRPTAPATTDSGPQKGTRQ